MQRHLQKTTQEKNTHDLLPSPEQMAQLHGLRHQAAALAPQVNYPVNSVIFGSLLALLRSVNFHTPFGTYLEELQQKEELSSFETVVILFLLPIGTYTLWYGLWQVSSSLLLKQFPNGIGLDQKPYARHLNQQKVMSVREIKSLSHSLRKLIEQQKTRIKRGTVVSVATSIVFPILYNLNKSQTNLTLSMDFLGPYITVHGVTPPTGFLAHLLRTIPSVLQRLPAFNRVYQYWSDYNTPKQLKNCQKRLAMLNYSDTEWTLLSAPNGLAATKSSAVFMLDLSSITHVNKLQDEKKAFQPVSATHFIIELHRVLLESQIPALISEDNKIYVSYFDRTPKTMQSLKTRLEKNLLEVAHYEKQADETLRQLNSLTDFLPASILIPKSARWNYYRDLSADGDKKQVYYNFNIESLPIIIRQAYLEVLPSVASHVKRDKDIVTIWQVFDTVNAYQTAKKALAALYAETRAPQASAPPNTRLQTLGKKPCQPTQSRIQETMDSEADREVKPATVSLPNVIYFSKGVWFSQEAAPPASHLDEMDRAYRLHIPWLSPHRTLAFASFDPKLMDEVKTYVSQTRIIDQLKKARVHGLSRSHKDKVGSVGIQTGEQAYQTREGEVKVASLKMKFPNNLRFYGQRFEVVQRDDKPTFIHYRFDGWGFGH